MERGGGVAIPNDRSRSLKPATQPPSTRYHFVAIPNDRSRSLKLVVPNRVIRIKGVAIPNDRSRSLKHRHVTESGSDLVGCDI